MNTLFITGANRGIGLALVKLYLEQGWRVLASCRAPQSADALWQLEQQFSHLQIVALDITNYAQMTKLAASLTDVPIDLVINNAGVYGPKGYAFGDCDVEQWKRVMEVNVIAPLKLAEAFTPQLRLGKLKTFAVLSSKVGSMTNNTKGGGYIYRSSKAALNSVIKSLSNDLLPEGIKTVALHPGWVKTDMGGPNALISAEESAQGLKQVLDELHEAQSGGFYDYQGLAIPW
ncbi:SDR family oxidoreductase [Pseudoalteromonas rubra]|uniref:SDR family oxidoreductase n=1 Tax=Pseudoalteromonas rubra TaxID=43658 RepID=UPI000F77A7A9|nr:SDR family oxidoreductase [Pseudoalteromonas rubra]